MLALVDVNNFYASAEAVFDLSLRGKAIVILSNNDGCCIALSRQAKELGITRFSPYFKIKDICDKYGVVVKSSNYALYGDLSNKLMQVIGGFAQRQHVYSIDEAYLDMSDCMKLYPNLYEHGHQLRRTVWKQTRLPVCVGYAPTLTLSKVANHAAKKVQGFNGVAVLRNPEEWEPILAKMETSDIWGLVQDSQNDLLKCKYIQLCNYPRWIQSLPSACLASSLKERCESFEVSQLKCGIQLGQINSRFSALEVTVSESQIQTLCIRP